LTTLSPISGVVPIARTTVAIVAPVVDVVARAPVAVMWVRVARGGRSRYRASHDGEGRRDDQRRRADAYRSLVA
jgi:hypothetical protein